MLIFFIGHWFSSLFVQTFFLHRFASHRMFKLSERWLKFWYVTTVILQGVSFLNPRAYAILHRRHHAYSDGVLDPHSPMRHRNVFSLMRETYENYLTALSRNNKEFEKYGSNIPEWPWLDRLADQWSVRIGFVVVYTLIYIVFAPSIWWFLLLPIHFIMGPIHGAIVNWGGHKYGYVNHPDTGDHSRNTLPFDFLTLGELFQNNHHHSPGRLNFAHRGTRLIQFTG